MWLLAKSSRVSSKMLEWPLKLITSPRSPSGGVQWVGVSGWSRTTHAAPKATMMVIVMRFCQINAAVANCTAETTVKTTKVSPPWLNPKSNF